MNREKVITYILSILVAMLIILPATYIVLKPTYGAEYDMIFCGDSIMASDHSDWWDIPTIVGNELKETTLNAGYGGYTMSNMDVTGMPGDYRDEYSMIGISRSIRNGNFKTQVMASQEGEPLTVWYFPEVSRKLNDVDWKKVKYIFIEHGANDYLFGVPVDDSTDKYNEYTFGGALRQSIENIQKGAPNAQIILMTPIYMNPEGMKGDCNEIDYGGGLLKDYVEKEKEIAKEYGLYVIDNFTEIDINKDNYEEYLPGGLHPNLEGNTLIAENICRHMKELNGNP